MKSAVRAVLFDLDGTLLDTLPDLHACVNTVMAAHGYPAVSLEETREAIGNGARRLMERLLPKGAPLEERLAEFRSIYAENSCALTQVYDGARETCEELKRLGCRLGVITNKPHEATVRVIKRYFPSDIFDFVAGDSGDFPVKPDPSLARYAMLSLRVSPAETLFAGDGETDFLTAKNAGMRPLSVLWGYRTKEQLLAVGASEFVERFDEILRYI